MSVEKNKATVLLFFDEVCNNGKLEILPDIFAEHIKFNGEMGSPDVVKNYLTEIHHSFDNPYVEVQDQLAEKDLVSTRRVWTGVQKKEYLGRPPTCKLMRWTEISVVRFVDGKIAEDWVVREIPSEYFQLTDKQKEFLVKDYELKTRYLSDHFQRMWTRFNFFVTIESALVGSKLIFGGDKFTIDVVWVGLVFSFIWYIMGAQDRHLVTLYRREVDDAARKASREILNYYSTPVGSRPKTNKYISLADWYIERISVTRLAAWIPFVLMIAWLITAIVFLNSTPK